MIRYQHLIDLTDKEIHNILTAKQLRPIEIEQIKRELRAAKDTRRSEQGRKRTLTEQWDYIISPLTNEQRTVRAMIHYQKKSYPNPERKEAYAAYAAVLEKLKTKLRKHQRIDQRTPREQIAEEQKKGRTIPNDGQHWVDWIPHNIKSAIHNAFATIPHTFKARGKLPFLRVMPEQDNAKLRARHIKTAKTEVNKLKQELSMIRDLNNGEPSEAEREVMDSLAKFEHLLHTLLHMDDDKPVPLTWGEVLVAYMK